MTNDMYLFLAQGASPSGQAKETQSQTQQPAPNGEPGVKPKPKQPSMGEMLWPLLLMFVVIYFVMFRGQRKKQQQHKTMLQQLKKNDRIRTIGGIIGTVVDVRDDEVVIKIDEANNSKMRLIRSAIATVIVDDDTKKK